mmetsp:Transcript_26383/g.42761  ORF Transcript_26383/g.42761 Transcript_26383/m.42761 type:complete len:776 (+) Transcript_26383:5205-7532(+)
MSSAWLACVVVCALVNRAVFASVTTLRHVSTIKDGKIDSCNFAGTIKLMNPMSLERGDRHFGYGLQMQSTNELIIDYVNHERCGIKVGGKNYSVSLETIGDSSSEDLMPKIAEEISGKASFVLGPYSSDLTGHVSPVTQAAGKILVAGGSSRTSVYKGRNMTFGSLPPADKFFVNTITALAAKGATTIAYVVEEGSSVCAQVPNLAAQHNLSVLGSFNVSKSPTVETMVPVVEQLKALNADVVISCMYTQGCISYVQAMRKGGVVPRAQVLSACWGAEDFRDALGTDAQYLLGASPWDKSLQVTDNLTGWTPGEYSALFEEYVLMLPQYQAASAAGSLSSLLQAIEQVDSLNSSIVAKALRERTFETVYGHVAFDENGQQQYAPLLLQYNGLSQIETIWPATFASSDIVYPLPSWAWRDCFLGNNCSGAGSCMPDGSCECQENFESINGSKCVIVPEENKHISPTVKSVCLVMFWVNGITAIGFFFWTFLNRRSQVVRASQGSMLCAIAIGAFVSSTTILTLIQDDSGDDQHLAYSGEYAPANLACRLSVWLYTIGFVFTFAVLFGKMARVRQIFQHTTKISRVAVSMRSFMAIIAVMMAIDGAVIMAWQVNDPLKFKRTVIQTDVNGYPVSSVGFCESENSTPYVCLIFLLHLATLLYGCFLCYVTSGYGSVFSEAKYVSVSMVSSMQVLLLGAPVLFIVSDQPVANMFLRAGIVALNDFGILCFIFLPKIIAHHGQSFSLKSEIAVSCAATSGTTLRKPPDTLKLAVSSSGPN